MRKVKRRIFSGAVCEQLVYSISDRAKLSTSKPRPRFKDEAERIAHKTLISRRHHRRLVNENFSPASWYGTLTFDAENECHTFEEAKKARDLYYRRLKRKYPDSVVSLYIGRGKTTHRLHLHILVDGIPKEYLEEQWKLGRISRIDHLREHCYYDGVDHGQDYTGLAGYLFNHWTPEQGGHRWKMSKNARRPETEDPTECRVAYSKEHPPRPPKGYILVESTVTEYGYQYFKYVVDNRKKKQRRPKIRGSSSA